MIPRERYGHNGGTLTVKSGSDLLLTCLAHYGSSYWDPARGRYRLDPPVTLQAGAMYEYGVRGALPGYFLSITSPAKVSRRSRRRWRVRGRVLVSTLRLMGDL